MDLTHNLKQTLDKTYQLAVGLEQVSSMIYPRKIGPQGRKRLMNINREIKNFAQLTKSKRNSSKKHLELKKNSLIQPLEIIPDSPGYLMKKRLSGSIKEINERVKMSRAGKRIVGKYVEKEANEPYIIRNIASLQSSWHEKSKMSRGMHIDDEKPQPYVPLTSAKIEDPIVLPSFEEFLEAKGVEYVVRKGKDELFYRIERAAEKISRLRETLDQRLLSWNITEEKKRTKRMTQPKIFQLPHKSEFALVDAKKNEDLRKVINQYYAVPSHYSPKKASMSLNISPANKSISLSSEAEDGLEESLRDFYRSKALENRKLTDILEKISKDRPYSMQQKISLIQHDNERYKNKLRSIEKFNDFREQVEHRKRVRQFRNFKQAVGYFEVLEDYKKRRYEPNDSELLLLELWRKLIESGWVVTKAEINELTLILTEEEQESKPVQILLEKFLSYC